MSYTNRLVYLFPRIVANSNGCAPLSGNRAPNFVLLDFVNIGQGLQAVNQLNGFA